MPHAGVVFLLLFFLGERNLVYSYWWTWTSSVPSLVHGLHNCTCKWTYTGPVLYLVLEGLTQVLSSLGIQNLEFLSFFHRFLHSFCGFFLGWNEQNQKSKQHPKNKENEKTKALPFMLMFAHITMHAHTNTHTHTHTQTQTHSHSQTHRHAHTHTSMCILFILNGWNIVWSNNHALIIMFVDCWAVILHTILVETVVLCTNEPFSFAAVDLKEVSVNVRKYDLTFSCPVISLKNEHINSSHAL